MRTAAVLAAAAAVLSYLDHAQQDRTHGAWIGTTPRYSTYGDRAKQPLVIIPGLDGCTVFFQGVVPELVRDFFVVVYDLPLYNGQNYTFSYLAADVTKALDELAIERRIVGESFMARRSTWLGTPERVEALVLLSSLAKTELTAVVKSCSTSLPSSVPGTAPASPRLLRGGPVSTSSNRRSLPGPRLFVDGASGAHHASALRIKIVARLDIDRVPRSRRPCCSSAAPMIRSRATPPLDSGLYYNHVGKSARSPMEPSTSSRCLAATCRT